LRTSSDPADSIAIEVRGLGKKYRLQGRGRRHDTVRDILASAFTAAFKGGREPNRPAESFWALKDVSFQIRHGENVGVLGLNGAGKSTLLKVLSRVTAPTTGQARIHGRLGSLLEVGTGFHGELTGRENIFLYGAILGMKKSETERKFEEIVAFAELDEFINMPVKRYSSGMYVRLAFAVAAHLEPDILLLDEVLSVGDLPFQRKCMEFARNLQKRRATIILVSHNMFSIKSMCDRVIYLRGGRVQFDGPTEKGVELYEADCRLSAVPWASHEAADWPIAITDVRVMDEAHAPRAIFDHGERMRVRVDYTTTRFVDAPNFVISIMRSDGVACCCYSTELDGIVVTPSSGRGAIELLTPPLALISEHYRIEILVREKGFQKLICAQGGGSFHVRHPMLDTHFGVFHEPGAWEQEDGRRPATLRTIAMGAGS
jgi:lipopolysaccharide transport system ATP-binding protein